MGLLEVLLFVYGGGVAYSVIHDGASPIVAVAWPLNSALKICVWLAKRDPQLGPSIAVIEALIAEAQAKINQAGASGTGGTSGQPASTNPPAPTP